MYFTKKVSGKLTIKGEPLFKCLDIVIMKICGKLWVRFRSSNIKKIQIWYQIPKKKIDFIYFMNKVFIHI